jgi:hypothetical protein
LVETVRKHLDPHGKPTAETAGGVADLVRALASGVRSAHAASA